MPLIGGANRNNYIPGGNNTSPKSGGNRTPTGKGSGSWVSGGSSNRGREQNTPSYKPSTSFSKRGGNYSSWGGFSSSGKGKGLGYSPYGNNSSTSTYGKPATPGGINFQVKNRGTALTKGLGVPAFAKKPKSGNPYVWAVWLFFHILLGNQDTAVTTLPEHLRQPGEQQEVAEGKYSPLPEIQSSIEKFHFFGTFYSKNHSSGGCNVTGYWRTAFPLTGTDVLSETPELINGVVYRIPTKGNNGVLTYLNIFQYQGRDLSTQQVNEILYRDSSQPCLNSTRQPVGNNLSTVEVIKLNGNKLDPDYPGAKGKGEKTESTTDHSKIEIEKDPNKFPPGIRPPLSSNTTARKPEAKVPILTPPPAIQEEQEGSANPLPVPLPLPDPPPIPEKTIEEALKDALEAGIQAGKKGIIQSSEIPKTISTIKVKRADGTTITVRQREATEKEVQASRRAKQRSKDAIEANKEAYYEARPWLDPKTGKRKQRFPFGEPEVPFYTEADNLGSLGNPYYKLDLKREPALKVPKQPPASSPPPGGNKTPTGNVPIVSDDPQPDTDDKKNQLPIPPPAIQQNKEGECQGCGKALSNKLDGLNALLGGTSVGQNANILDIVRDTNRVINSPEHGLAKVQDFARTAWRVTRADKVMAGVSMVMSVHNAMMLSNNLLSTVSEATNMTLNALGIRDEEDIPIDFGAAVKEKIEAVMKNVLGEAKYVELTARIAKANRIYQASINLLDTTYSLFDSARSVAELTAENTGKIGNALRDAGVVYEDAYNEFVEEVNSQNQKLRGFGKLGKTLGQVSEGVSTVTEISSEVVELKENIEQVKEEKQQLADEINEATEKAVTEKEAEKELVQVTAEIDEVDFEVAPPLSTEGN